jgi:NADPH:quinone reductase-like Zn-dependent oxidoreductase
MKAAIVWEAGSAPVYADFDAPRAEPRASVIDVLASSLSPITKQRASGAHYSASGGFPFVPGIDGTGVRADGRRVYFVMPNAPHGAMAEHTLVEDSHCIALPDSLDPIAAAAMAIPGMSSWAALVERAKFVQGETVLINGATGTSGRLAVQVARHLGARKIIATGRNATSLASLGALGADVTIALTDDGRALEDAFRRVFSQGIDVVLDYLWGASAEALLAAAAKAGPDDVPIRFVEIGAASGSSITLPSAALRSSSLVLMGSGIGSLGFATMRASIAAVLAAAAPAGLRVETTRVPLSDVAHAWDTAGGDSRIVFTP